MGQIHFCAGKSWCCCSYQQEMTFFLTVKSTQLRLFMSDSHGAMVSSWLRWKVSLKPKVFSFCLSGSCKALRVAWHSGHCSRTSRHLQSCTKETIHDVQGKGRKGFVLALACPFLCHCKGWCFVCVCGGVWGSYGLPAQNNTILLLATIMCSLNTHISI